MLCVNLVEGDHVVLVKKTFECSNTEDVVLYLKKKKLKSPSPKDALDVTQGCFVSTSGEIAFDFHLRGTYDCNCIFPRLKLSLYKAFFRQEMIIKQRFFKISSTIQSISTIQNLLYVIL